MIVTAPSRPASAPVAAPIRALLLPAVMTALMLALLLGLGFWQVHRLHWKAGILAAIARAEAAPAIPLGADPPAFAKVRATGRLNPTLHATYGAEVRDTAAGPRMGAQYLEVLERDGAPPVLVVRGWVPEGVTPPTPPGEVSVDGFVRRADHAGMLSATDDRTGRRFYTLDPAVIGAALGLPSVAPFTLVALGTPRAGDYPQPATTLPRPPNDHFVYALTWFGLAASLLVIFLAYARRTLRR
jgi:surfeit locus 1 family protein